jgi:hypothetical protein
MKAADAKAAKAAQKAETTAEKAAKEAALQAQVALAPADLTNEVAEFMTAWATSNFSLEQAAMAQQVSEQPRTHDDRPQWIAWLAMVDRCCPSMDARVRAFKPLAVSMTFILTTCAKNHTSDFWCFDMVALLESLTESTLHSTFGSYEGAHSLLEDTASPWNTGSTIKDVYREFTWMAAAKKGDWSSMSLALDKAGKCLRKIQLPVDYCVFRLKINDQCSIIRGPVMCLQAMNCWCKIGFCRSHETSSTWVPYEKTKGSFAFFAHVQGFPSLPKEKDLTAAVRSQRRLKFKYWLTALTTTSGLPMMEVENMLCKMQCAQIHVNQFKIS